MKTGVLHHRTEESCARPARRGSMLNESFKPHDPVNCIYISTSRVRGTLLALIVSTVLMLTGRAPGQQLQLSNPHWNITLSDFGYSDFLLDNTPGLEGREYLSGEWGAAIGYALPAPAGVVTPQWLEPNFMYPDWPTNSSFHVVSPLTQIGTNADGLPVAESVIANNDVEITLRHEMMDTVVGTPMGGAAASSGGAGAYIDSDRYVLRQTCTVRNITLGTLANVRFFQLLHGLNSQRGVHDNRTYPGVLDAYHFDTTLAGVDPWAVSAGSSPEGLEDFIGFHSSVVPSAHEIGRYGIEGIDNHSVGKPSDGVHLSVENDWMTEPFASRVNTDFFAPDVRWVAGAQRWELGNLASGQLATIDLILSLRTGTRVTAGSSSSGGCNGGAGVPGGVDYDFSMVTAEGSCFASYSQADEIEVSQRVASGEFEPISFLTPSSEQQIWKMEFSGASDGDIGLTFAYDPTLLPAGFDETTLCIYQSIPGGWTRLTGTVDDLSHTVQVTTTGLSSFALGTDGGETFVINAFPMPAEGGTVTGDGAHAAGSSATLVATANPGYVFSAWTENGALVSSSPSLTFIVQSDRQLDAVFTTLTGGYAVTTTASPSAGGSTTGGGEYADGADVTVQASANAGYKFSKWMEGDVELSRSATFSFAATANAALIAVFKPVYVIEATPYPAAGGEVEVDPSYELGDTAKLKATPNDGYAFVNWTQNGTIVSWDPVYTFTVSGNRTLVANFADSGTIAHDITTSASPSAGGSTTGDGSFPHGSPVTVTASTNAGYAFVNWTEGTTVVSTAASYSFTAGSNRSLVANFTVVPATVTITLTPSPAAGGTVSGGGAYAVGSVVKAVAVAKTGYAFANWTENGRKVSNSATYQFTAKTSRSLVANFKRSRK